MASLGPAGEKLVRIASIQTDYRSFARGGPGAVMGSKKLKALAVQGTKDLVLADMGKFIDTAWRMHYNLNKVDKGTRWPGGQSLSSYGTGSVMEALNAAGGLPTCNWQRGTFEEASEIAGAAFAQSGDVLRHKACMLCPSCSKISRARNGAFPGSLTEGPEYENQYSFGSNLGNRDRSAIIECERLCDELGLDGISTGVAIGFAVELYQRGAISEREVGFPLSFGDVRAFQKLVQMIANQEGFGKVLSQGVNKAAEIIGEGKDAAMHVKGMELPGYDPRAMWGMGLAYATSDVGGSHMRAWTAGAEVLGKGDLDPFSVKRKASFVKAQQDFHAGLTDSLIMCKFARSEVEERETYRDLLRYATGWDWTYDEVMRAGERIYNMTRSFNVREGAREDSLPSRILDEPLGEGPGRGKKIDFRHAAEYYS